MFASVSPAADDDAGSVANSYTGIRMGTFGAGGVGIEFVFFLFRLFLIFLIPSGKSEAVKATVFFAHAWGIGKRVALTGSTGVAGVNIGGDTLHSFAGLTGGSDAQRTTVSAAVASRLSSTWLLVVDEVSMVSASLMTSVLDRFKRAGQGVLAHTSFLFLGDFWQCPAIGAYLYNKYTVVNTPLAPTVTGIKFWLQQLNVAVTLTENMRARDDATFQNILAGLRQGHLSDELLDKLNTRVICDTLPVPVGTHTVTHSNKKRHDLTRAHFALEMLQRQQHDAPLDEHTDMTVFNDRTTWQTYGIVVNATMYRGQHRNGKTFSDADFAEAKEIVMGTKRAKCSKTQKDANPGLHEALGRREYSLRLYVGQQVMFAQNLAVTGAGIANGTLGTIVGFMFHENTRFDIATECFTTSAAKERPARAQRQGAHARADDAAGVADSTSVSYTLGIPSQRVLNAQGNAIPPTSDTHHTPIVGVYVHIPNAKFPPFAGLPAKVFPVLYPTGEASHNKMLPRSSTSQ